MANKKTDWLSWTLGIAGGIVLWQVVKPKPATDNGRTLPPAIQDLPQTSFPSRYANLESVQARIDQVRSLYGIGQMSLEQALSESEGLALAANSFSNDSPGLASIVYGNAIGLQDELVVAMRRRDAAII